MPQIALPDGTLRQHNQGASAYDVAVEIGPGLAKAAIAAEIDGQLVDLHAPIPTASDSDQVQLRLLTKRDTEALNILRHSCAHVMAQAVMRLYQGVQLIRSMV